MGWPPACHFVAYHHLAAYDRLYLRLTAGKGKLNGAEEVAVVRNGNCLHPEVPDSVCKGRDADCGVENAVMGMDVKMDKVQRKTSHSQVVNGQSMLATFSSPSSVGGIIVGPSSTADMAPSMSLRP